jgi:hypothetical protein
MKRLARPARSWIYFETDDSIIVLKLSVVSNKTRAPAY